MKAPKPSLPAILALLLTFQNLVAQTPGKTYFVRPGGGADRTLANGLTDVDCSAATGQNCAFGNPALVAWPGTGYNINGPSWVLAPGDSVVIHAGQYGCGYAGPNPGDYGGAAIPGNPYGSCFPSVPSGTTWLGDGSATTQIFGRYGAGSIFDAGAAGDVTISGLELTDHEQCGTVGNLTTGKCSSGYPLSNYAGTGITTSTATKNLVLRDLNIHGLTNRGIIGPIGGHVTVDHVRIAYNGWAGWDFDDGHQTPSTPDALVTASYLTVEWNGCNEEYPVVHKNPAFSCFDQGTGGYGDGIGTPNTPLNASIDHSLFRYNTQDGFDFLHTSGSNISVTNSQSYGNEGQQWKLGAMQSVLFQNNQTVHNCSRIAQPVMDGPAFPNLNTLCRAGGDGIAIDVMDGGKYSFQNNSYAGYGKTTMDVGCGVMPCTKPNITHQNNLYIGYASPVDGQLPGVFYWETSTSQPAYFTSSPLLADDHNIYFNMRTCPAEAGSSCADPKIAAEPAFTSEASLDAIDFDLTPGSPAKGTGTNGVDIGALFGAAPPPPSITPYSGTINPAAITVPAQTITVPVPGQTISVPVPASTVVVPAQTVKVKGQNVTIGGYSITVPASTVTYTIAPSSVTGAVPAKTVTPAPIGINCPVVNNAVTCTTK